MSLSIIIGGDIVPSFKNLEAFCSGNVKEIIDDACLEVLNAADFRVYNLETPLTDEIAPIKKDGANFAVPEAAVCGLKLLSPDALCLANNHCRDQGETGLLNTVEVLNKAGIIPFGYGKGKNPAGTICFERKGYRIAIVACAETEFTIADENTFGAAPYHDYWTNKYIADAKRENDLVIVLYHGGKEYYPYTAPYQKERCRLMVDAGADVVLCQHSHCISCFETYNDGTILYGQGNFIFRQRNNRPMTKEGLLVRIELDDNSKRVDFIPVVMDETDKVCLALGEQKDNILAELERRSQIIKNDIELNEKYLEFAKTTTEGYNTRLLGSSRLIRFIARVYRKMGGKVYNTDAKVKLISLLQNEAHREIYLSYLKKEVLLDDNHARQAD